MNINFLDFDRLNSYEDRQAVNQILCSQFTPPHHLFELCERWHAENQKNLNKHLKVSKNNVLSVEDKSFNKHLSEAFNVQKDFFINSVKELFIQKTIEMLHWVKRFKFTEQNENWNPEDWVLLSEKLNCEDLFTSVIIEQSSSLSLKSWYKSLNLSNNWERKWLGWNRSFHSVPALALRWLPAFLDSLANASLKEERKIFLLSHTRGINWFRHFLFQETGRNADSLKVLDSMLAEKGIERLLSSIDYSPLFVTSNADLSISLATEKMHEFLETCPRDALKWLQQKRLSTITFKFGFETSEDALFLKYLKMLSQKNQAGHEDLKSLVFAWQKHSESGAEDWEDFLPPGLIHHFDNAPQSPSIDDSQPPEIEIPLTNKNRVIKNETMEKNSPQRGS